MINVLTKMVLDKKPLSDDEYRSSLKEVIQETILCALSTTDFFTKAAFYGGTAARIFSGLPRFSEDLDFTLLGKNNDFSWKPYFSAIEKTFRTYGLSVVAQEKEKIANTDIRSAFLKENEIETLSVILPEEEHLRAINHNQVIKIKFEVDSNPPLGFNTRYAFLSDPFASNVRLLDNGSLFAGKIGAVISRSWGHRVKGRDLYDYLFYVSKRVTINTDFLISVLKKSEIECLWGDKEAGIKQLLKEKFSSIDYALASEDVRPFLKDASVIDIWSPEYFISTLDDLILK